MPDSLDWQGVETGATKEGTIFMTNGLNAPGATCTGCSWGNGAVIFCHGNNELMLQTTLRKKLDKLSNKFGLPAVTFEYTGYGYAWTPAGPSEATLQADVMSVFRMLVVEKQVPVATSSQSGIQWAECPLSTSQLKRQSRVYCLRRSLRLYCQPVEWRDGCEGRSGTCVAMLTSSHAASARS